jgi:hypothetical protein
VRQLPTALAPEDPRSAVRDEVEEHDALGKSLPQGLDRDPPRSSGESTGAPAGQLSLDLLRLAREPLDPLPALLSSADPSQEQGAHPAAQALQPADERREIGIAPHLPLAQGPGQQAALPGQEIPVGLGRIRASTLVELEPEVEAEPELLAHQEPLTLGLHRGDLVEVLAVRGEQALEQRPRGFDLSRGQLREDLEAEAPGDLGVVRRKEPLDRRAPPVGQRHGLREPGVPQLEEGELAAHRGDPRAVLAVLLLEDRERGSQTLLRLLEVALLLAEEADPAKRLRGARILEAVEAHLRLQGLQQEDLGHGKLAVMEVHHAQLAPEGDGSWVLLAVRRQPDPERLQVALDRLRRVAAAVVEIAQAQPRSGGVGVVLAQGLAEDAQRLPVRGLRLDGPADLVEELADHVERGREGRAARAVRPPLDLQRLPEEGKRRLGLAEVRVHRAEAVDRAAVEIALDADRLAENTDRLLEARLRLVELPQVGVRVRQEAEDDAVLRVVGAADFADDLGRLALEGQRLLGFVLLREERGEIALRRGDPKAPRAVGRAKNAKRLAVDGLGPQRRRRGAESVAQGVESSRGGGVPVADPSAEDLDGPAAERLLLLGRAAEHVQAVGEVDEGVSDAGLLRAVEPLEDRENLALEGDRLAQPAALHPLRDPTTELEDLPFELPLLRGEARTPRQEVDVGPGVGDPPVLRSVELSPDREDPLPRSQGRLEIAPVRLERRDPEVRSRRLLVDGPEDLLLEGEHAAEDLDRLRDLPGAGERGDPLHEAVSLGEAALLGRRRFRRGIHDEEQEQPQCAEGCQRRSEHSPTSQVEHREGREFQPFRIYQSALRVDRVLPNRLRSLR